MGRTPTMSWTQRLIVLVASAILSLGLFGCYVAQTDPPRDPNATDQMWTTDVDNAQFYVFQIGDKTLTTDLFYDVDIARGGEPLRDGGFYRVIADVTYLEGGVAGYVSYPEIHEVKSYEEVSPFRVGLPSISEKTYGLMLIGDYADGDVLFNERNTMAVWKDGEWMYHYDKGIKLSDGTVAGIREGVTDEEVQAGVENGVLCCEDYFALLPDRSVS